MTPKNKSGLAIDPGGKKGCAWALGAHDRLCAVGVERKAESGRFRLAAVYHALRVAEERCHLLDVDHVIVERPEYQGARSDGARIQDLLELAWNGAMFAATAGDMLGASIHELSPYTWKGSTPKPMHHLRFWGVLSEEEREVFGGDATGRVIRAAAEKGALERWKRPGGDYYPRGWLMADMLDAGALHATFYGRLKGPRG